MFFLSLQIVCKYLRKIGRLVCRLYDACSMVIEERKREREREGEREITRELQNWILCVSWLLQNFIEWLKQQTFISLCLEAGKFKIKLPFDAACQWNPFPDFQRASFSLCHIQKRVVLQSSDLQPWILLLKPGEMCTLPGALSPVSRVHYLNLFTLLFLILRRKLRIIFKIRQFECSDTCIESARFNLLFESATHKWWRLEVKLFPCHKYPKTWIFIYTVQMENIYAFHKHHKRNQGRSVVTIFLFDVRWRIWKGISWPVLSGRGMQDFRPGGLIQSVLTRHPNPLV